MNPLCKVCNHPEREEIERRLAGGMTNTAVAAKWGGMSQDAVRRHRINHLTTTLHTLTSAVTNADAKTALERAENLFNRAETILKAAEENGNTNTALAATRELRAVLELLSKLSGELNESPQVNIVNLSTSQEWVDTRAAMFRALQEYPEARLAVAQAVRSVES